VLSPYRHANAASAWAAGLNDFAMTTDIAKPELGRLRVGTVQGFKGLEAGVVVLVGIDARSGQDAACKTAWGLIGQAAHPMLRSARVLRQQSPRWRAVF